MLSAIMLSAMFSIALSAKRSGGKAERQLIATHAAKSLLGTLKNYVSADTSTALGPNKLNAGPDTWSINTPAAVPPIVDSLGNVWALQPGCHTLTGYLDGFEPGWFISPPYTATIAYCVTTPIDDLLAGRTPNIQVTLDWNEP